MNVRGDLSDLEGLIDRIDDVARQREQVAVDDILAAVGYRSFGPVVLVAGLITLAPLVGDIPGVPTLLALLVLLTAGQLLFRRQHIWLPGWIVKRRLPRNKLRKGLAWVRKPARGIDRCTRPRLTLFVEGPGLLILSLACIAVALAMPAMEIVPFSANGGGAALVAFGLAMIARDGAVALFALIVTAGTLGFVGAGFL
ncbi:exopolysaccharide biosynthesis protein [Marinobacter halodurans]|uniref:Exopolysaccharide biosynthesis protein n=1 Tax=Marinobacter halodurans TaxID=2528979 RepID=A0ABY1ZI24_9GAMM|nr:exopolysaccharide biosynthesis protein [Marinobacter halodurans]TBW49828.1 exopolysaccharide biosynthesis protein [Marinobacter halodurans]